MRRGFIVGDIQFSPSLEINYLGVNGHFWTRWVKTKDGWINRGTEFLPSKASHKDVASKFYEVVR